MCDTSLSRRLSNPHEVQLPRHPQHRHHHQLNVKMNAIVIVLAVMIPATMANLLLRLLSPTVMLIPLVGLISGNTVAAAVIAIVIMTPPSVALPSAHPLINTTQRGTTNVIGGCNL